MKRLIQDDQSLLQPPFVSLKVVVLVKSATTSASTCGCIHPLDLHILQSRASSLAPKHTSVLSEAVLSSTCWYPQQLFKLPVIGSQYAAARGNTEGLLTRTRR